jgi:[protein-PII] uridylyltransferase
MLEIFLLMTERPGLKGMTARATRACGTRASRSTPPSARSGQPRPVPAHHAGARGIIHALRRMNETSILGRYLPNFRRSSARCSTTCSTSTRWTSTS